MSALQVFCDWIYATGLATSIRESEVVFPAIETVHVLALALMIGTVAIVDLRLLNRVFRDEPASLIAARLLPLTWIGFALILVSGLLLFVAEAQRLYTNPAFVAKFVLLIVAGLNALILHATLFRRIADWDLAARSPLSVRVAAAISLASWSAVIVAGRAIAYF